MGETVAEFYDGRSIFITGSTGFLGKVLLEKLLYSCPGLDRVYILVRSKKNMDPQQRLARMLELPLFSRLRERHPKVLKKIVVVPGNILEPQLGIKPEDEKLLTDNVSIVFHVAATIKFSDSFEVTMNINVAGTKQVLDLSRRMKNIKTFVYVSTAYSNSLGDYIEEVLYPPPASLKEISKLLNIGITEEQTKQLIGKRPNAYIFSKALTESVVAESHGHIPTVIVRPSIVGSSYVEPVSGWVDNWLGATRVLFAIGKGLARVMLARPTNIIDITPVDYVSNLIIVAASRCKSAQDVLVYNSSTSEINPLTLQRVSKLVIEDSYKHNFNEVPMPFIYFTPIKSIETVLTLLLHVIPAFIADVFLLVTGQNTRYKKMQSKLFHVRANLEYFATHSWIIRSSKTRALFDSLTPSDKEIFPCNPADEDWDRYIPTYMNGIRQFLYKP